MSRAFNLDNRKVRRVRFSDQTVEIIRQYYADFGAHFVTKKLTAAGEPNYSLGQIRHKAATLGLTLTPEARSKIAKGRNYKFCDITRFTPEMDAVLRAYYPENGAKKTAERLTELGYGDIKPRSVCNRSNRLNVRVNRQGLAETTKTAAAKRREGYNRRAGSPRNEEKERALSEEEAAMIHLTTSPWGRATKRPLFASICLENSFVRQRLVARGRL